MAAVLRLLGKSVFVAKGITFIFRAQATVLWWLVDDIRPTGPRGQMTSDNLRTNARWLHDYLNIMRWEEPGEFLVDTAGLGTGGALRLGGARFPLALAGALGARAWVKQLLGVETKTIAGIIPREFAAAFDAGIGVALVGHEAAGISLDRLL